MEHKDKDSHLKIPTVRKSIVIANEKRKKKLNETFGPLSSPCATSTVEKQGYKSLTGYLPPFTTSPPCKDNLAHVSYDSSLGLLNIDDIKGLGEDSLRKSKCATSEGYKSLSFNPKEITARSTNFLSTDKENFSPNVSRSPTFINTKNEVEDIIRKAKDQSDAVDDILRSNNDPCIQSMRMSLQSLKQSILVNESVNKKNSLWNRYTKDLGFSYEQKDSSIRDSMFASKVNMSEEEMSWIKEHADLPVDPSKLLSNSVILEENSITFNDQYSKSNKANPFSDSKMSVGNYFEERSENINHILNAASPEKKHPHPPLYETTYVKESNQTNEISIMSENIENICNTPTLLFKQPQDVIVSDTLNCDDTTNHLLSLTQIKSIIGKLDTESPSVLIDHMLGVNKKKEKALCSEKRLTYDKTVSNKSANMFHSTKRDDLGGIEDRREIENLSSVKVTPVSKPVKVANNLPCAVFKNNSGYSPQNSKYSSLNDGHSNFSNSQEVTNNRNSVLKGSTKSTIVSETTDNSSAATVIHMKNSDLPKIKESESILNTSNKKIPHLDIKENCTEMGKSSPKLLKNDSSYQSPFSQSDVSREIKDIMSPMSVNSNEIKTPESGRHVKRLLDHFRPPKITSKNGWISPIQAKIHNSSKECIISKTPFKNNKSLDNIENIDNSYTEYSINVPSEGDWIKINSVEQDVIIGVLHNLHLKVESMGSRWVSLNISIKEIFIDNQPVSGIASEIITIQDPISNVLLNANTKCDCIIQTTCWIPNQDIHVNFEFKLVDIVTKSTSNVNHCAKIRTRLPKITVESMKRRELNCLEFPIVPEECETCMPVIIWNESSIDTLLKLDIKNSMADIFEIINAEIVPEEDMEKSFAFYSSVQSLSQIEKTSTQSAYNVLSNKKTALIVLILFRTPKIENDKICTIDGILDISLVPKNANKDPISVQKLSIMGRVGTASLLIRNNQKSDKIFINQGSTEDIEMLNAGSAPMSYKLFFTDTIADNLDTIVPCEDNPFVLSKSLVSLDSGEKTVLRVSFPVCDVPGDLKRSGIWERSLVFQNLYTSQTIDIVGVSSSTRCQSQQSGCSVESSASQSQEISLKSTKKELSWGSLKLGDSKTQDITFKNKSNVNRIKVIATVIGDGFKISDNDSVSSLMFTLQPQECRSLLLEFKPVQIGAHIGSLRIAKRFNHSSKTDGTNEPRLLFKAPLHGIGGQSKLVFRDGIFRHAGAQGLPLGSLNESGVAKQIHFTIWNKGTALGFALFNIDLKWKYRNLGEEVYVTPSKILVKPDESVRCSVTVPRRALNLARGKTGETEAIASLTVLNGDEATRLRIKRIYQNEFKNENQIESWNKKCQGKLKLLCSNFPDEDIDYCKINAFKETSSTLWGLLDELQQKEVSITYDVDLDYSVARLSSDLDETLHFQTVGEDLLNTTLV